MASLFSKIVKGEVPCYKVAENDSFLAFLDIMPVKEGHVLVVPKLEIDYIFDIEDDLIGEMMIFAKSIAKKIEKVFPCNRVGVTVIGLEVPHAHVHLIPIDRLDDMNFSKPKLNLSDTQLTEIAQKLFVA
ncbi:MAG: HIT family protein [Flavobacteriales bacterium]|nr:HIT family protein [Flavobacteriales bacterium]